MQRSATQIRKGGRGNDKKQYNNPRDGEDEGDIEQPHQPPAIYRKSVTRAGGMGEEARENEKYIYLTLLLPP